MNISDTDIICALLEDDACQMRELNSHAEADPSLAKRLAHWQAVLGLIQEDATAARSAHGRALDRAMQRAAVKAQQDAVRHAGPKQSQNRHKNTARGWRWMAAAGAAIAAAVILALVIPWPGQEDSASPMRSAKQHESVESGVFSAESEASGNLHRAPKTVVVNYRLARGVAKDHFRSIAEALNVVQQGGTIRIEGGRTDENLRITTPIVLIAGDGD